MNESSTDTIINWMHEQAKNKAPIDPLMWLEGAMKLQILATEDTDKLIELESEVSKIRDDYMGIEGSAPRAEVKVKTTDAYKNLRKQQAKCETIKEMIRLAKKYATLKGEELRSGL